MHTVLPTPMHTMHQHEKSTVRLPQLSARYNVAHGIENEVPMQSQQQQQQQRVRSPPSSQQQPMKPHQQQPQQQPQPQPLQPHQHYQPLQQQQTIPTQNELNVAPSQSPPPPASTSTTIDPSRISSINNTSTTATAKPPSSNVERFWAEEQARKGKPRPHPSQLGGVSLSKAKKKQAYFQAPEDTKHARVMWEKMKNELDGKWKEFEKPSGNGNTTTTSQQDQGENDSSSSSGSSSKRSSGGMKESRREEKEEASVRERVFKTSSQQQPQPQQQQQQQPPLNTFSRATSAAPHSTSRQNLDLNGDHLSNNGSSNAPPSVARRTSAYSFTNVRKEEIQNAKQPLPNQSYGFQPHPPPTTSANASSSSTTSKPTTGGAQFSSFTRPATSASSSTSTSYFSQQSSTSASTAANPNPSSATSVPSSYPSTHTTSHSHSHSTLYELYSRYSVKDLKRELLLKSISPTEWQHLVEKSELVMCCIRAHLEGEKKAEMKRQAEVKEQEKETQRDAIIHEVGRWAKDRSIKSMLNELNGCIALESQGHLKKTDTLAAVSKSYKRALLRIHPDKHMDNEIKHLRATEVFKYVSNAFNEYKKRHEKM